MGQPTKLADRVSQGEAARIEREERYAEILRLDALGVKRFEIAERIGMNKNSVSRILISLGKRDKARGVHNFIPHQKTEKKYCERCGVERMVRKDQMHTKYCAPCGNEVGRFKRGQNPHNKGGDPDKKVMRKCKTCGVFFEKHKSSLLKKPNYRWGSYCSKPCFGEAMRTPGSRYSAFR